jgi:type IV pilus assembly protein PilA
MIQAFFFRSPDKRYAYKGFTLLELLVTITIVGILSAIAVPQYRQYRARAFDTRARFDLETVALAEEAYFMDHESYAGCSDQGCSILPGIKRISPGVSLQVQASQDAFVGIAQHAQGTGRTFTWSSDEGGLQLIAQ